MSNWDIFHSNIFSSMHPIFPSPSFLNTYSVFYYITRKHSNGAHSTLRPTLTNRRCNPFPVLLSFSLWSEYIISYSLVHIPGFILSSHYGSYYSAVHSPSTVSFVFSLVIPILLLAGRNKKKFIRLQIGHLFSINLELWQERDLFYAYSLSL